MMNYIFRKKLFLDALWSAKHIGKHVIGTGYKYMWIRKKLFWYSSVWLVKTFAHIWPEPDTVSRNCHHTIISNKYDVSYSHSYLIMLTRLFFVTNFLFTAILSVGIDFILVSQAILPLDGTKRINSCLH